jgi:ABC-type amino acid transport substrate-binding protein
LFAARPLASIFLLLTVALPASAATLDRVRETGSLRVGFVDGARPFSYRDESGNAAGYSVALCQLVADAVKEDLQLPQLKIEFVPLGAEERFGAVKEGKVDLLCAAGAPTVKRREEVSFSIPIFLSGVGALVRRDAPAAMRAILEGKPEPYRPRWRASLGQVLRGRILAAPRATTAETWLAQRISEFGVEAKMESVDGFPAGVELVADHRADALFGDRALLLDAARRSPSAADLTLLDRRFTYEAVALALQRTDEDFRLLVDRALSRLYRSDQIVEIYARFFGKPDEETLRFLRTNSLAE